MVPFRTNTSAWSGRSTSSTPRIEHQRIADAPVWANIEYADRSGSLYWRREDQSQDGNQEQDSSQCQHQLSSFNVPFFLKLSMGEVYRSFQFASNSVRVIYNRFFRIC